MKLEIKYYRYINILTNIYYYLNSYLIYSCKESEKNNDKIIFENTYLCIKNNNIIVPLYFLELFDNNKFKSYNDNYEYDINFSVNNNIFTFYTKGYLFYKCELSLINKDNILNEYHNIIKTKQIVLFIIESSNTCEYLTNPTDNSLSIDLDLLKSNFFKKDIILNTINTYTILDTYPNYKYILVNNVDWNLNNYISSKSIEQIKKICEKYKFILLNSYHAIDYVPKKKYYLNIPNFFWNSCYCGYATHVERSSTYFNFKKFFPNIFKMPLVKFGITNNNILNRIEFFKINNFDINKKLITIFTSKISYIWDKNGPKLSEQEFFKTNKLVELVNFLSKEYNIIFKPHYSNIKIINNKIKIIKMNTLSNYSMEVIEEMYKPFKFIDKIFKNEIYKHTDFAITFNSISSIYSILYLYNIPLFHIDNFKDTYTSFIPKEDLMQIQYYNNLSIYDFQKKYIYGMIYYNKYNNNDNLYEILKIFLSNDYNKYEYFENNPYFGNNYFNNYDDITLVISNKIKELNMMN